ncbi:hypothetical protein QQG55_52560 [Brugia pahangi]
MILQSKKISRQHLLPPSLRHTSCFSRYETKESRVHYSNRTNCLLLIRGTRSDVNTSASPPTLVALRFSVLCFRIAMKIATSQQFSRVNVNLKRCNRLEWFYRFSEV